jgi:hypothetical protein
MRGLVASLLRRATAPALSGAGLASLAADSAGAPAAAAAARASSIGASRAPTPALLLRGFAAAAASTSGRAAYNGLPGAGPLRGVTTTVTAAAAAAAAAEGGATALATAAATSPSAAGHAVAALKARLMPATGRNQFRRKWKKQAEIKVRACMCARCMRAPTQLATPAHDTTHPVLTPSKKKNTGQPPPSPAPRSPGRRPALEGTQGPVGGRIGAGGRGRGGGGGGRRWRSVKQ